VFNTPTQIRDWSGEYTEMIAPGAFARSIKARKPIMQFDHGTHPIMGSLPIAAITKLREDAHGLYVEARMFDTWMTEPLQAAIREQAVDGMSFRFRPVKDEIQNTKAGEVRIRKEVQLFELGPVVGPAYKETSVALRALERAAGITLGTSTEPVEDTSDEPASATDPDNHSERNTDEDAFLTAELLRQWELRRDPVATL
jgi:HK97 family phage prohead protease